MILPLTVPGKLESLSAIAQFVIQAARLAHLDEKTTYKLRLAVDEIATNIIQHGYAAAGLTGEITCCAELDDHHLMIALEDWGLAYDPLKQNPTNSLEQPLTQRPMGGLGIYLAINSVDDFQYERVGDRNRHIFIVRR
ncbi:MAG: ATP-binding protein [Xenococcaceae cyanobacterium MO_167.B27]|nr:ATP-binding protein [Xenococcaceae cyanobacterium MO_167.B27]